MYDLQRNKKNWKSLYGDEGVKLAVRACLNKGGDPKQKNTTGLTLARNPHYFTRFKRLVQYGWIYSGDKKGWYIDGHAHEDGGGRGGYILGSLQELNGFDQRLDGNVR